MSVGGNERQRRQRDELKDPSMVTRRRKMRTSVMGKDRQSGSTSRSMKMERWHKTKYLHM